MGKNGSSPARTTQAGGPRHRPGRTHRRQAYAVMEIRIRRRCAGIGTALRASYEELISLLLWISIGPAFGRAPFLS